MSEHYPNTGKLGQALKDFKLMYAAGATENWTPYWKEFAQQAMADLIALEFEVMTLKLDLDDERRSKQRGVKDENVDPVIRDLRKFIGGEF